MFQEEESVIALIVGLIVGLTVSFVVAWQIRHYFAGQLAKLTTYSGNLRQMNDSLHC